MKIEPMRSRVWATETSETLGLLCRRSFSERLWLDGSRRSPHKGNVPVRAASITSFHARWLTLAALCLGVGCSSGAGAPLVTDEAKGGAGSEGAPSLGAQGGVAAEESPDPNQEPATQTRAAAATRIAAQYRGTGGLPDDGCDIGAVLRSSNNGGTTHPHRAQFQGGARPRRAGARGAASGRTLDEPSLPGAALHRPAAARRKPVPCACSTLASSPRPKISVACSCHTAAQKV